MTATGPLTISAPISTLPTTRTAFPWAAGSWSGWRKSLRQGSPLSMAGCPSPWRRSPTTGSKRSVWCSWSSLERKTARKKRVPSAWAVQPRRFFCPFCPESPTLCRRNYPGWANAGEAPRQRHRGPPGSAKKGPARGAPALLESYKPITGGYFASTGCLAGDSSRTTTLSMRWSSIFSTWRATPSISMSSCSPSLGMALRRVTIRPPRVS